MSVGKKVSKKGENKQRFNDNFEAPAERYLILPDLHEPFGHEDMIDFCTHIYDKYECTNAIFVGDIGDNPTMSLYIKPPNAWPQEDVLYKTCERLQLWAALFPNAFGVIGNHCARIFKRLYETGVGHGFLTRKELLVNFCGYPEQWEYYDNIIIRAPEDAPYCDVVIQHGDLRGLVGNPVANLNKLTYSLLYGHAHTSVGVSYRADTLRQQFTANVGCGGNPFAYVFDYNKKNLRRDIIACGVLDKYTAHVIPMPLKLVNGYPRWDKTK